MKLRRKKKKPPGLMLTSLLDMFTIILIFLIVSFDSENQEFELNTDLTLPESSAKAPFKAAANVAITQRGVLVEGVLVAPLVNGRASAEDHAAEQITPLVEALERVLAVRLNRAKTAEDEEDENIVMIQADRNMEYKTLYLVMRSARIADYNKFRLAVMKK